MKTHIISLCRDVLWFMLHVKETKISEAFMSHICVTWCTSCWVRRKSVWFYFEITLMKNTSVCHITVVIMWAVWPEQLLPWIFFPFPRVQLLKYRHKAFQKGQNITEATAPLAAEPLLAADLCLPLTAASGSVSTDDDIKPPSLGLMRELIIMRRHLHVVVQRAAGLQTGGEQLLPSDYRRSDSTVYGRKMKRPAQQQQMKLFTL